jgi:3-oxoacyl-[acyl-carrier protein] reductase
MRLYIIYGSESSILKNIYDNKHFFIRIYNKSTPEIKENCIDVSIKKIQQIKLEIKSIILKHNISKLIFIGSGFYSENKIFASLTDKEITISNETNILNYQKILQQIIKIAPIKLEKILIYLSSFRSIAPTNGTTLYSASKAYGEILFKSLAYEYSRFNLRTFSIRMGFFEGRMKNAFNDVKINNIKKNISLNRFGSSEELIETIEFIIHNKYLSGGVIEINGGLKIDS